MCGIFCCVRSARFDSPELSSLCDSLKATDAARGPDSQSTKRVVTLDRSVLIDLFASELHLRGCSPVLQPHEQDGNILCWNGEIFDGMNVALDENDGTRLFDSLRQLDTLQAVHDLFATIEGPYAFVFYSAAKQRLFFGRDPLGRRSLLLHRPDTENPYLLISSVSLGLDPRTHFEEVSTDHLHCIELDRWNDGVENCMIRLRRTGGRYSELAKINRQLPPDDLPVGPDHALLTRPVDELIGLLDESVRLQMQNIPAQLNKGSSRLAVLFSGGIDCTILAFLAHRYIPLDEPIDLLNVAFENPRKIKFSDNHQSYMVPDRVTGLEEVEELRRLCPRTWNFVEVDVPYEESQAAKSAVENLMFPSRTVMDLSLALALYFASRGVGLVRDGPGVEGPNYTSPARVLLNGLGSDELLGGYGRHRSVYESGGWRALVDELQLEIDRIPLRNLGRDDRMISCHGKEARHPFLSLDVVARVAALPIHFKLDPRLEQGVGDKMLLRLAARKLGLFRASSRKKRAMQFGSHSAKMHGERRGEAEI